jgi:ATP-dependent Lon protease
MTGSSLSSCQDTLFVSTSFSPFSRPPSSPLSSLHSFWTHLQLSRVNRSPFLARPQHEEKLHIARQSLLPKQLAAHALTPSLLILSDEALLFLITHYTREAGVRSLERQIAAVCRAKAVEYAEAKEEGTVEQRYRAEVTEEDVERILGKDRYDPEEAEKGGNRVGVATGLAYSGSGNGGILRTLLSLVFLLAVLTDFRPFPLISDLFVCFSLLFFPSSPSFSPNADIESTHYPGSGRLVTTGQLGDVIQESASVALSWIKSNAFELGISKTPAASPFSSLDLHIHLPAGAIRKDGPSAGVALTVGIVSLSASLFFLPFPSCY